MKSTLTTRSQILLPTIIDEANLYIGEVQKQIPFTIRRFYVISDVLTNAVRGMHAHKKNRQALFCLKGKVTLILDDGKERVSMTLSNPKNGILLDRMVWHEMLEMDTHTVLLVVASDLFSEADYIRDYKTFLEQAFTRRKI